MQTPKSLPGILYAWGDKGFLGFFWKRRDERSGVLLLIGYVGEPVGCCAAAFKLPPEERAEFFAASVVNSSSVR